MKKITLAILLLGLVMSCSKEESKPTIIVEPPIKFTVDATPNSYEYVNRVSQNTINASFTTLERIDRTSDTYYVYASITSDFKAVKADTYINSSSTTTKPYNASVTLLITKQQFPFQGNIYFKVVRTSDNLSSETRLIKVNWN